MIESIAVAAAIGGFWTMMSGKNHFSKGIGKLIEMAGDQIGYRSQSTNNVIRAKSDAEVQLLAVRTEIDIDKIRASALNETQIAEIHFVESRAIARETVARSRKQRNFEQIVVKAAVELNAIPDDTVEDRKVDEDWTVQFFGYAEDVGNEEMQLLWAKLLAGEIKRPGTVSLRTLNAVKALSREECELFAELCRFVWRHENPRMTNLLISDDMVGPKNPVAIFKYASLQKLTDCGLVESISYYENDHGTSDPQLYSYYSAVYKFARDDHQAGDVMAEADDYQLTPVGREL
jgi:hypothetical protein